jgi:hypothetical protein
VLVHAHAVVGDIDEDVTAGPHFIAKRHLFEHRAVDRFLACLDRDHAGVVDRLGGVDDQVQHDLAQLRRIGFDERQRPRAVVDDRAVARDRCAQQVDHFPDQ